MGGNGSINSKFDPFAREPATSGVVVVITLVADPYNNAALILNCGNLYNLTSKSVTCVYPHIQLLDAEVTAMEARTCAATPYTPASTSPLLAANVSVTIGMSNLEALSSPPTMASNRPRSSKTPSFSGDAVAKGRKALRTSEGCAHHAAPRRTAAASVQTRVRDKAGLQKRKQERFLSRDYTC